MLSLYASYGYGFRSGGFNSSGSEATVNTFYNNAAVPGQDLCLGPSTDFDTTFGFTPAARSAGVHGDLGSQPDRRP